MALFLYHRGSIQKKIGLVLSGGASALAHVGILKALEEFDIPIDFIARSSAGASMIFHSLFGPIRATLNYFPKQKEPRSFQVSYGYVIFNNRVIH